MRSNVAAAFAGLVFPGVLLPSLALAASVASPLTAPAQPGPSAQAADAAGQPASVRVAMRQQTLPPGGKLAEHKPEGERYLFVVSGRLKVSDLVTGEEQVVEAGKMAAEQPGDWHVAQALGSEPVTLYVIDRGPAAGAAQASGGGN